MKLSSNIYYIIKVLLTKSFKKKVKLTIFWGGSNICDVLVCLLIAKY